MSNLKDRPSFSEYIIEPLPLKRTNPPPCALRLMQRLIRAPTSALITLSDLLMLLVVFFVILFSMELQKRAPNISARAVSKDNQIEKKASAIHTDPSLLNTSASIEKDLGAIFKP